MEQIKPDNLMTVHDAYRMGWYAHSFGKSYWSNPFPPRIEHLNKAWRKGFDTYYEYTSWEDAKNHAPTPVSA